MKTLNQELVSRIKTIGYNVLYIAVVAALDALAQNVANIGIPKEYVVFFGLFLAQVSKFVKNYREGNVQ